MNVQLQSILRFLAMSEPVNEIMEPMSPELSAALENFYNFWSQQLVLDMDARIMGNGGSPTLDG